MSERFREYKRKLRWKSGIRKEGAMQPPDLNQAENMHGPLDGEIRTRLQAVIQNPNPETWADAKGLVLNTSSYMTLWQAVLMTQHGTVPLTADPNEVPTSEQIIQAIRYATS